MSNVTPDIVGKLWNLCNILKDDGVTYHQYVTELTYLLFLKMAQETDTESLLPEGYRWEDLTAKSALERLNFYKRALLERRDRRLNAATETTRVQVETNREAVGAK